MRIAVLIFTLLILQVNISNCAHIVGTDMSYECLGEGSNYNTRIYRITFIQYAECSSQGFDEQISLSLWNMDDHTEVIFLRDTIVEIANPNYPCLEFPLDICINKATFSIELELAVSDSSYFLVKQFCCRIGGITNITSVGSSIGTTQYVEINSAAQYFCNNSPSFQAIPPTGLCVLENISVLQNAIDVDGDQLIYEFCSPLDDFPGEFFSYPPPHLPVQFVLPTYSEITPLGNGVLNIDVNSGFLSGEPMLTGKFAVGICVKEYRNGQLLSTIRRDIILNIITCPSPVASIDADSVLENGIFLNHTCEQEIELINTSAPINLIDDFVWIFNIEGMLDTFFEWDPSIFFPEPDIYSGHLILNPDSTCPDTANILINVVANNIPSFIVEYDTCVSGPVQFLNDSYSANTITDWEWSFGDSTTSINENPLKYYDVSGLFNVSLKVTDNFNCVDSVEKIIEWKPAPETIIISPDVFEGCKPLSVFFDNLSWPIDSTYSVHWNFGDGLGSSNILRPYYTYREEGSYSVFVSVTSPLGCYVDTTFNNLLTVHPLPVAQFNYTPEVLSNIEPEIHLIDNSQGAIYSQWAFDEMDIILNEELTYTFTDTGHYTIRLIVSDINNCKDTITQVVDVTPMNKYFLPNAFTPNNDGVNDIFKGKGVLINVSSFKMTIWNRSGQNVFETINPNQGWNGRFQNIGKPSQTGVFIVTVSYEDSRGNVYNINTPFLLIR